MPALCPVQLDVAFGALLGLLPGLVSVLLQLLMASAPNVKRYSGTVALFNELSLPSSGAEVSAVTALHMPYPLPAPPLPIRNPVCCTAAL